MSRENSALAGFRRLPSHAERDLHEVVDTLGVALASRPYAGATRVAAVL